MPVALPPVLVTPCRGLGCFHQQKTQKCITLLADVPKPLPTATGVLTRNEPNVAADLLAAREPSGCSDDQHEGQCRQCTYSRVCHEPHCFRPSPGFLLDGGREFVDRGSQPVQQFE